MITRDLPILAFIFSVEFQMVSSNESVCPCCGGRLKYYDNVTRVVRSKGRQTKRVRIRRLYCTECGRLHRELPCYILPYKQYEAEVVRGVQEGLITCETLGYEDYPCEMTMTRWRAKISQHVMRE